MKKFKIQDLTPNKGWIDLSRASPEKICKSSLARYDEKNNRYLLESLNSVIAIECEKKEISLVKGQIAGKDVKNFEYQLAVISYLNNSSDVKLSGEWVNPKEFKDGPFFFVGIHEMPTERIVKKFGKNPEQFLEICKRFGGEKIEMLYAGYALPVLPKIPIAYILWEGDSEFPPEAKILFDKTAERHLALDALLALANSTTRILIK